ncbi:thioredoxin family protein [Rhizobium sp. SL86]|uniref:thioredoxin family protein n=1 Tax=Rhizobium sp. SL86 TaxID=2995148 RepID=UPI002273A8F1|nr:thioredoxin family protein [Rhizobium sp. SL86]MCY1664494.1 thioredoxin family protein [Rhizobium sp. SL86]
MKPASAVLTFMGAAALSLATAFSALAAEIRPFQQEAFAAAQKAGQPIVVDITASWCPTCKAQKPIIDSLAKNSAFKDLTIFTVDFDAQKDVVRALGANMQSTLIGYRGTKETARSVGDTKAASIETLFKSTTAM